MLRVPSDPARRPRHAQGRRSPPSSSHRLGARSHMGHVHRPPSAVAAVTAWKSNGSRIDFQETGSARSSAANVFSDEVMKDRLPDKVYKAIRETIKQGEPLDPTRRRRRGRGHEGLGHREGRDPLHPLVPADDRPDGREARLASSPPPATARRSPSSPAASWSAASPTPPASPPAASAPPSRPAATPPGTRPAPPSSSKTPTAPPSASRPPSVAGPARRSTRRRPCSARWRPSRSRPSAS